MAWIYKRKYPFISTDDWKGVGKDLTEEDVDPEELKKGIKVEMEHTDNEEAAKRIALDHLFEIPNYYSLLIDKEKKAKKNKSDR